MRLTDYDCSIEDSVPVCYIEEGAELYDQVLCLPVLTIGGGRSIDWTLGSDQTNKIGG